MRSTAASCAASTSRRCVRPMTDLLSFSVDAVQEGERSRIAVTSSEGVSRTFVLEGSENEHYRDFFTELHEEFGTRLPHLREPPADLPAAPASWQPLLTENIHPQILSGYGDPAVLKT